MKVMNADDVHAAFERADGAKITFSDVVFIEGVGFPNDSVFTNVMFVRGQTFMFGQRCTFTDAVEIPTKAIIGDHVTFNGDVALGDNVDVGNHAKFNRKVVAGQSVTIGADCVFEKSVDALYQFRVGDRAKFRGIARCGSTAHIGWHAKFAAVAAFGSDAKIGLNAVFDGPARFGEYAEIGGNSEFHWTATFAYSALIGNNCIFHAAAEVGIAARVGSGVQFRGKFHGGNGIVFGNSVVIVKLWGSTFGHGTTFGEGCKVADKEIIPSVYSIRTIEGFGTARRRVYIFNTTEGPRVLAGCFWGSLAEFKQAASRTTDHTDHQAYVAFAVLLEEELKRIALENTR